MRCRFSPEALPLESTPVDNLFILEYMPHADGMQLRVYLYGLMLCRYPSFDASTLPEALSITEEEALHAFLHWQQEGLVRVLRRQPLEVEYIPPAERGGTVLTPGKYGALLQGVQSLLAPRLLRAAELRRVYDWVDVYGLSEEAVLELVAHCKEMRGDRVSMTYMETVARAWADDHVHSPEEARARAESFKALTGGAAQVLKRWNKSRLPTVDELHLYETWTAEWGFTQEAVLAACARLTAGDPSFKYLDGVLQRLRSGGLQTEEAIALANSSEDASLVLSREVSERLGAGRGLRPAERAQLQAFLDGGLSKEALLYAAEQAQGKERPVGYLKKLLSDFVEQGVKTLEEAKQRVEARAAQSYTRGSRTPAQKYPQRRISEEDIAHIIVNLDEET